MTDRIRIADIPVDLLTVDRLHERIHASIASRQRTLVLYANAHLVQLAHYEEKWLLDFYRTAGIILCDGAGIQLAARITGQKKPDKIAYNIWFWDFIKFLRENSHSIFLLGGNQEAIDATVANFLSKEPALRIAGSHNGYFQKAPGSADTDRMVSAINQSKADVLLVGLGMPIQEKWIGENIHRLNVPVIMTCGGAFDFFSGRHPVAPKLMRVLWLEWLYRLLQEPRRMLFRYTIGNLRFLWLVITRTPRNPTP
jgi:N-acetylglucosaminyldiphosphoundecaprenol N-acetyl-beta-D-mannosaminyltransferase